MASTGIINIIERQMVFVMECGNARAAPLYKVMVFQGRRISKRAGISQVCVGENVFASIPLPKGEGDAKHRVRGERLKNIYAPLTRPAILGWPATLSLRERYASQDIPQIYFRRH
jgi:hypothetical protein